MHFEVTLLGCSAAIPANGHFLSGQVLQIRENWYLIDCGEWTQSRLNDVKIPRSRIRQIFISHLHGDHFFGLFGLITSYGLMGRQEPLEVYSPRGLEAIADILLTNCGIHLPYELIFHEIETGKYYKIFSDEAVDVYALPLKHRVPTAGFLFREKTADRHILPDKLVEYEIPYDQIRAIKKGNDFTTADGRIIANHELTTPPHPPRSFAYCSDTAYCEALIPLIRGVDLLYHETTFTEEHRKEADFSLHSTAKDAANIALKAGVGRLITGHYSNRYSDPSVFLSEAAQHFPNTVLGLDGSRFSIPAGNK